MTSIETPRHIAALCREVATPGAHDILGVLEIAKELQGALDQWIKRVERVYKADIEAAEEEAAERREFLRAIGQQHQRGAS